MFVAVAPAGIGPENVLVLYNQGSTEGIQVASYYSRVHPGVRLLGLIDVGLDEVISAEDYLSDIRPQVLAALTPSIDVLVTTKGLPLRIVNSHENPGTYTDPFGVVRTVFGSSWEPYSSLESELAQIDIISTWEQMGDQTWWIPEGDPAYPHHSRNLYYQARGAFDHGTYGSRLSSRLDGFTVADIKASIDRAQQAFVGPFHFVVDNDPNAPGATINKMDELADGPDSVLALAGVPYTYDNTDEFITDAPGPVVGYVSYGVHGGGERAPDGYLVDEEEEDALTFDLAEGAVFHTWESYNANSFVQGGNRSGQGLVAEWIARGGTVGTGHVEEPGANPNNVTNEDLLFEMLLDGYTWAEAAWSATRQLSFVNTVVGDPLMVFREVIPGDANMDGNVDLSDFSGLSQHYTGSLYPGTGDKTWGQADFDADGDVDFNDFNILANNYTGGGTNRVVPSPEPSIVVLLSMGVVGLAACAWRNRRRA